MSATLTKSTHTSSSERCARFILLASAGALLLSMPCCGENGPEATVWEGEEAVHWLGAVVAEQEKYLAAITTFSFTMNERWTTRLDELARDGIN